MKLYYVVIIRIINGYYITKSTQLVIYLKKYHIIISILLIDWPSIIHKFVYLQMTLFSHLRSAMNLKCKFFVLLVFYWSNFNVYWKHKISFIYSFDLTFSFIHWEASVSYTFHEDNMYREKVERKLQKFYNLLLQYNEKCRPIFSHLSIE